MKKHAKRPFKLPRSILALFPHLEDVTDATKNVEVTVNKSDCMSGRKQMPSECAMARAAQRQYHADAAVIGVSYSYIVRGKKAIRYKTPISVQKEIVSFDRGGSFAPGSYELGAVPPSNRLGRGHQGGESKGDHSAKRVIHRTTGIRVMERGSK